MTESVGAVLRSLRQRAGLSQLELALAAHVSQRHVSFVESGRSAPGRGTIDKLAHALSLGRADAERLYSAAGFLSWSASCDTTSILEAQGEAPALLLDAGGTIHAANAAFDRAIGLLGDPAALWGRTHDGRPRNLYRLTLHPSGLLARLRNPEEVARATLTQMRRRAVHSRAGGDLFKEACAWRTLKPAWFDDDATSPPAVAERYQLEGGVVSVMAVTAAIVVKPERLWLETYHAMDRASAKILAA